MHIWLDFSSLYIWVVPSKKKRYHEVEEQKDLSVVSSLYALPRNTFRHGGYSCRSRRTAHTPAVQAPAADSIPSTTRRQLFLPVRKRNPLVTLMWTAAWPESTRTAASALLVVASSPGPRNNRISMRPSVSCVCRCHLISGFAACLNLCRVTCMPQRLGSSLFEIDTGEIHADRYSSTRESCFACSPAQVRKPHSTSGADVCIPFDRLLPQQFLSCCNN